MNRLVSTWMGISTAVAFGALAVPASAAVIVNSGTAGTTGATALYLNLPGEISASQAITAAERDSFLGAPNAISTGLGAQFVTYDLGNFRLIDGAGQDFNVYEVVGGGVGGIEFNRIDVLVSADGVNFFNLEATALAAIDLAGDELHTDAGFRQSYNLGTAVTALGASEFRYLRILGTATGDIEGTNDFDLDGVGFRNFTLTQAGAIPEPSTWAMLIGGFGFVGAAMRRGRRTRTSFA